MAGNEKSKYNGISENKTIKINKTWKSFPCSNGKYINNMSVSDSYKDSSGQYVYTNQYIVKWFSENKYNIGTMLQISKINKAVVESYTSKDNKTYNSFTVYVEVSEYGQQQYYQPPQQQYYQPPQQQYYQPPQQQYYQPPQQEYQAQYANNYDNSDDDLDY